jgi:hypothetical protein
LIPKGASAIGRTSGSVSAAAPSGAAAGLIRASYPAPSTAATSADASRPVPAATRASSLARFTATSATPGTRCSARSTRPTHEAQVIPLIARVTS